MAEGHQNRALYDPGSSRQEKEIPFRPHSATVISRNLAANENQTAASTWNDRTRPTSAPLHAAFSQESAVHTFPKDEIDDRPPSRHLKRMSDVADIETTHRSKQHGVTDLEEWHVDNLTMEVIGILLEYCSSTMNSRQYATMHRLHTLQPTREFSVRIPIA
jgi:hypothetical protein